MPILEPAGALISILEGKNYVQKHLDIKDCLQRNVLANVPSPTPACVSTVKTFYGNDSNAFLFDVAMLKTLLETRDANGEIPKYLMVLTGAKFLEGSADINTPTIVLAGVNYNSATNKFYSMKMDKPALQQPPTLTKASFPDTK